MRTKTAVALGSVVVVGALLLVVLHYVYTRVIPDLMDDGGETQPPQAQAAARPDPGTARESPARTTP